MLRTLALLAFVATVALSAEDSLETCASGGDSLGQACGATGSSLMQAKLASRRVVMIDGMEDSDPEGGAVPYLASEPSAAAIIEDISLREDQDAAGRSLTEPSPVAILEDLSSSLMQAKMANHRVVISDEQDDGFGMGVTPSPSPSPSHAEADAEPGHFGVVVTERTVNSSAVSAPLGAADLLDLAAPETLAEVPASINYSASDSSSNATGQTAERPPPVLLVSGAAGAVGDVVARTPAASVEGGVGAGVVIMFAMVFVLLGLMAFVLLMQSSDGSSEVGGDGARLMMARPGLAGSPPPGAFKGNLRSAPQTPAKPGSWSQPVTQAHLAPSRPPSAAALALAGSMPPPLPPPGQGGGTGGVLQVGPDMDLDAQAQFCPDLVVPRDCECILVIPIRAVTMGTKFDVADMSGNVVLRVSQKTNTLPTAASRAPSLGAIPSPGAAGRTPSNRRIQLATANGDELAQCFAARPSCPPGVSGEAEFHLSRANGEFFARLARSDKQDRYALSTHSGARLHFWGAFEHHAVNVTDDAGRLLATTEMCTVDFDQSGEYYRLRVAPLTDCGLVLCSLLCIDHLGQGQL